MGILSVAASSDVLSDLPMVLGIHLSYFPSLLAVMSFRTNANTALQKESLSVAASSDVLSDLSTLPLLLLFLSVAASSDVLSDLQRSMQVGYSAFRRC